VETCARQVLRLRGAFRGRVHAAFLPVRETFSSYSPASPILSGWIDARPVIGIIIA